MSTSSTTTDQQPVTTATATPTTSTPTTTTPTTATPRTTAPETTAGRGWPGVWPTLSYRDAEAALRYLVDVVGFTESAVMRGDPERPITHAELAWPDGGGIMFGSEPAGGRWSGKTGGPGTSTAYLSSDDVSGIAERVTAAGWQVLRPLAETDYGSLEFAFLDPEGNAWSVGTYRGAES